MLNLSLQFDNWDFTKEWLIDCRNEKRTNGKHVVANITLSFSKFRLNRPRTPKGRGAAKISKNKNKDLGIKLEENKKSTWVHEAF